MRGNGTVRRGAGVLRRLQSYRKLEWLVVGNGGEGSKDLHTLGKTMADSKVAAKDRVLGRDISPCYSVS